MFKALIILLVLTFSVICSEHKSGFPQLDSMLGPLEILAESKRPDNNLRILSSGFQKASNVKRSLGANSSGTYSKKLAMSAFHAN